MMCFLAITSCIVSQYHDITALFFSIDILVSFSEAGIVVDESVNSTNVCVEVCEGDLKRNATVEFDFQVGTAQCNILPCCGNNNRRLNSIFLPTAPDDFNSTDSRIITFTPDNFQSPYCFTVYIVDDMTVELTESINILLSTSDEYVILKMTNYQVEIADNDRKLNYNT